MLWQTAEVTPPCHYTSCPQAGVLNEGGQGIAMHNAAETGSAIASFGLHQHQVAHVLGLGLSLCLSYMS